MIVLTITHDVSNHRIVQFCVHALFSIFTYNITIGIIAQKREYKFLYLLYWLKKMSFDGKDKM